MGLGWLFCLEPHHQMCNREIADTYSTVLSLPFVYMIDCSMEASIEEATGWPSLAWCALGQLCA